MKRCPQCLFIYPETDTRCDFDNTALIVVDDAEIDAATRGAAPTTPATAKKSKRTTKKREPKSATAAPKSAAVTTKNVAVATDVAPGRAKRRRTTKVVIAAVG